MEMKWKALARNALPFVTELQERGIFSPAREVAAQRQSPMISVIVPAHNEEAYLGRTLEALQGQSYPRYEVIVIANACSDSTASLAQNCCDRLVVLPQKGISHARNVGARIARGDILLFLDADTLLEPGALEVIAKEFTRDFSAGTLKGKPDSPRCIFRLLYGLKNLMHACWVHKGSIGVILCWKDYFEAAGGFDEALHVMENSEFIHKLEGLGKYRCIWGTAATTSMRRYEKTGLWKTTALWFKLWLQSHWRGLRGKTYEPVR
jgi:glycosyltransferase involved in cell wall biosynthesis